MALLMLLLLFLVFLDFIRSSHIDFFNSRKPCILNFYAPINQYLQAWTWNMNLYRPTFTAIYAEKLINSPILYTNMARTTDYGQVQIGDKTMIDVPIEKDIFGKVIASEKQICEIIRIVNAGAISAWITFRPENSINSFALQKRITTKVRIL